MNSATNRTLAEGTSKYNSQQLADHIDYYGAFYETDENWDYTSVMLYTLNKHLEATLPFLSDIIHDPVFPIGELDIFIQNYKQRLVVENEKVNSVARRKFNEIIFGKTHPYGYFVGTDDYDKLNREDLVVHHRNKYDPANCTIIISGLVKDQSVNLLNKFFGKKPATQGNIMNGQSPEFSPLAEKIHLVEKEGAVQSAIRIGKFSFNRTHPDYAGMAFLNTVLGGYFGISADVKYP